MPVFSLLNSEIEPQSLEVQVATSLQIPGIQILGLASAEIMESRERIRSALAACGYPLLQKKYTVNLAPADVRKKGTGLDFPIALALFLDAVGEEQRIRRIFAWGELSLDGKVIPCVEVARSMLAAIKSNCELVFAPVSWRSDVEEVARLIKPSIPSGKFREIRFCFVETLGAAIENLKLGEGQQSLDELLDGQVHSEKLPHEISTLSPSVQLSRQLEIALVGRHHLLLLGPKGCGKSTALRWIQDVHQSVRPGMELERALICELYGKKTQTRYRKVGLDVRPQGLLGCVRGDSYIPGEFALAHNGILFADEFLEWGRDSREVLRKPLEDGAFALSRAGKALMVDSRFQLLASANLCPCGGVPLEFQADYPKSECICGELERRRYFQKLSGPILDRLDMTILVKEQGQEQGAEDVDSRPAADRIKAGEEWMQQEFGGPISEWSDADLEKWIHKAGIRTWLNENFKRASLRGRHKAIRVALSIIALDSKTRNQFMKTFKSAIREARMYRSERILFRGAGHWEVKADERTIS